MKKLIKVILIGLFSIASAGSIYAQRIVTGTVVDNGQKPVPGVSVVVTGTAQGNITDADGKYSIEVPQESKSLTFSFVGMISQEVTIGTLVQINVTLAEEVISLGEVVVVGFGTQKKVNLTGAVSSVSAEDFADRPVQNVSMALQGLVNGLNIKTGYGGGQLDVAPIINVRGVGTIGQGSQSTPLILINGIEGDPSTINPQDIDNISILKDAASSSIYGSRAAFGVILVTTKSGKMGNAVATSVNFSSNVRLSSPINMPAYCTTGDFLEYYERAYTNSGQTLNWWSQGTMDAMKAYANGTGPEWGPKDPLNPQSWGAFYGNTEWFSKLYKSTVPSYENNLSITGGGKNYSFYVSGSLLDQSGQIRMNPESWKRSNLTVKVANQITKNLTVDYIGNFSWVKYDAPTYLQWGFYYIGTRLGMYTPYKYPDGSWGNNAPLSLEQGGRYEQRKDFNQHKLTFTYEPVKDWTINVNGSTNLTTDLQNANQLAVYMNNADGTKYLTSHNTSQFGSGNGDTYMGMKSYRTTFFTTNIYTDYVKKVGDGHYFKGMLGFNAEQNTLEGFGVGKSGLISNNVIALDAATLVPRDVFGNSQTWSTAGFFGRINYNYKERYLLEVNSRYDGASRFIGDKRWALFPSISAGWNITNEDFFEPQENAVDLLKLRGSFGSLGNMNTTNWYPFYPTQPIAVALTNPGSVVNWAENRNWLINGAYSNIAGSPGLVSSALTWEKVQSWDIGLDLELLNNRLRGTFDIFRRNTIGMVGPALALPNTLGTSIPATNNADMNSSGFEIELSWRDEFSLMNSSLSYGIRGILSDEQQTVTRYVNPIPTINSWYPGRKMGEIWGYTTVGMAKTDEEMQAHLATLPNGGQNAFGTTTPWQSGDIMYKDLNGDGKISAGSQTIADPGDLSLIGNNAPRYKYGINFDAAWKGFDVQVFLQGVAKRDLWPASSNSITGNVGQGDWAFWGIAGHVSNGASYTTHMDYFRPDGDPLGANLDAYYPRPYAFESKNQLAQTRYLQNAAYMRLKNVQVGYTLPIALTQKLRMKKVRAYFSGENLLTFTKLTPILDPEANEGYGQFGGAGVIGEAYPISKVISFGLTATF